MKNLELIRDAWGKFGIKAAQVKEDLITLSNQAIEILSINVDRDSLTKCEELIKKAKELKKTIIEQRKAVTSKFDEVYFSLTLYEKSVENKIKEFENEVIKVKKIIEAEIEQERLRKKLRDDDALNVENQIVRYEKEANEFLRAQLCEFYKKLVTGEIPYSLEFSSKYAKKALQLLEPLVITKKFDDTPARTPQIITEDEARDFLEVLLVNYEYDKQNHFEMIERQKLMLEEQRKIDEQKEKEKITAARLQRESTPLMAEIQKSLKYTYQVDMEENLENAILLISAFLKNKDVCMRHTSVKNWFNFSANNAAVAIAKAKTENENLNFDGITFTKKAKL